MWAAEIPESNSVSNLRQFFNFLQKNQVEFVCFQCCDPLYSANEIKQFLQVVSNICWNTEKTTMENNEMLTKRIFKDVNLRVCC